MREALPLDEFARLARLPADEIEAYRAAGLLDRDGDGLFDEYDVFRLQAVMIYRELGYTLDQIAEEAQRSRDSVTRRLFRPSEGTVSFEEGAARIGIEPERLRELGTALGFAEGTLDDESAHALAAVKQLMDAGLPWEAMLEGARVFGDVLRRMAEAEVRMIHHYLCERLAASGVEPSRIGTQVFGALEAIEPVIDPLVQHLHHDHLVRAAVEHAFLHLEAGPGAALETTVLFADLSLYTPLAQVHGDEVAAEILDRFDTLVRGPALDHGGTLVKQIGDEFMLTFQRPEDGVRFAMNLAEAVAAEDEIPAVRIGIHSGPVLYRVGDYVGNTVNIASRVAAMAMPNTVLVTEPVANAAEGAGIGVEAVGVRQPKGIEEPLALYRVVLPREWRRERDPVCGMMVGPSPAGRFVHDGAEFVFCSEDCLRRFLERPAQYAGAAAGGDEAVR